MRKRLIVGGFVLLSTTLLLAQDLEVSVEPYPTEVLPTIPVTVAVQVRNPSGQPVTLAYGYHGFGLSLVISRADGRLTKPCPQAAIMSAVGFRLETKPPGWCGDLQRTITCWPGGQGDYIVQPIVASSGPYTQLDGKQSKAWEGQVRPSTLHIRISEPQGVDRQALTALAGHPMENATELLKSFPTSTYAAYMVRHISGAEGIGRSDPARVIADRSKDWGRTPLEVINLLEGINVPFDVIDGKKIGGEIQGKVAIAWREKWFGIVLKAHPDIWFADELRLRSAIDQLTLKNYQAAQAELEAMSKDEKAPMAPKAKEYLGLMKQKGWIKS